VRDVLDVDGSRADVALFPIARRMIYLCSIVRRAASCAAPMRKSLRLCPSNLRPRHLAVHSSIAVRSVPWSSWGLDLSQLYVDRPLSLGQRIRCRKDACREPTCWELLPGLKGYVVRLYREAGHEPCGPYRWQRHEFPPAARPAHLDRSGGDGATSIERGEMAVHVVPLGERRF